MSTHNIYFHEEIRKISILFSLKKTLSGAMGLANNFPKIFK